MSRRPISEKERVEENPFIRSFEFVTIFVKCDGQFSVMGGLHAVTVLCAVLLKVAIRRI